jgi:DNA repair exonuclease SbcCD ATPase subunit
MSTKIKAIHIKALRGISALNLELNGKNLVLKGDNGTGKSSIGDALEFFFTGQVAHLKGAEGLSNKKHLPHVNFTDKDLAVKLHFDPGNISVKRTFKGIDNIPPRLKEYIEEGRHSTFILRRAQILEFINSKPADRYRSLGNIIGIADLDEKELVLMGVRDELKGRVESIQSEYKEILNEISELIQKKISKIDEVLSRLNNMLKQKGLPTVDLLTELNNYSKELIPNIRATVNKEDLASVTAIQTILMDIPIPGEFLHDTKELNSKIEELIRKRSKSYTNEQSLLELAKDVIAEKESDICPVCNQPINRTELLESLSQRIKTLIGLTKEASNLRTSIEPLKSTIDRVVSRLEDLLGKLSRFDKLSIYSREIETLIHDGKKLQEKIASAKQLNNLIPVDDLINWSSKVNKVTSNLQNECKNLLNEIGPTEEEKNIIEAIDLVTRVSVKLNQAMKIQRDLEINKSSFRLAEIIFSSFSNAKKQITHKIYSEIQSGIKNAYLAIHPNEPIGDIELAVKEKRRASAKLDLELFGKKGDPRALSSEGHLDSLGLCIFLAFIKKFNTKFGLMVLDDVVTSIDSRHRQNIAKLIMNEFRDKQIIITTHDEVWFEHLRACQKAFGLEGNFINYEIINWDLVTGPQLKKAKILWEEIQEDIKRGDKIAAGNKARQYLERLLKEACNNTQAAVPYKLDGRYEIGDLFEAAKQRLQKLTKGTSIENSIVKCFQELSRTTFMANPLSHDNVLQEELSLEEVRGFCDAVHNLDETLSCPFCHNRLIYDKQFRALRCSSEKCEDPISIEVPQTV